MRVLIVGGGGREHALAWKIARSPVVSALYCAPGNAGIASLAELVPIKANDVDGLLAFATEHHIDLTVVGPEAPLIAGIVERFEGDGLRIFGPASGPARLEGSKVFAKELMRRSGIPTADFQVCESLPAARAAVRDHFLERGPDAGVVIKADGLAAGKGVIVANGQEEAYAALDRIMGERAFGAAGDVVVIEERLVGEEASIMAITDGETVVSLVPSQDHKRAFDGDLGPNTGGMGAYAPVPSLSRDVTIRTLERIIKPAIHAIRAEGAPYRGVIYAGIMATSDGPKAIEFNCRLGDPETQVVLPLLESDLVPLMLATLDGTLYSTPVLWKQGAAVTVVAASGGYPGDYAVGKPISGLEAAERSEGCLVFHAGTTVDNGAIVTDGGRVLSVTGLGADVADAARRAYAGIEHIDFEGIHYRRDIASRALAR